MRISLLSADPSTTLRYAQDDIEGVVLAMYLLRCGRKYTFTKYIDTYSNNIYINDIVCKCNRLDKCGYHYTPRQYFEDNPWLKEDKFSSFLFHRENEKKKMKTPPPPPPRGYIPEWVVVLTSAETSLVTVVTKVTR